MSIDSTEIKPLPVLDAEEIRILGALMEKAKATPEYYPLTLNALTAACNQKSARYPVVNYEEQSIVLVLDRLKRKGLVATATGGSSRVVKYRHNIALHYQFTPDELAVLCLLFLRGPLTPGEINSSSTRLYPFDDLAEVHSVLEKLTNHRPAYIRQLARQPGQKEARYMHLFGDESLLEMYTSDQGATSSNTPTHHPLEERVSRLEQELADLKAAFEGWMKEWTG